MSIRLFFNKSLIFLSSLAVIFLLHSSAGADTQTNFTISPPPLGYPEFPEQPQFNHQLDLTFAAIRGETVSLNGGSISWIPRYGFSWGAIDTLLGFFSMSGDAGPYGTELHISFVGINVTPVTEIPVIRTSFLTLVLFGGLDISHSATSFQIDNVPVGTNTYDITFILNTTLYGPVGGLQMHIPIRETLVISPFFYFKYLKGEISQETDPAFEYLQTSTAVAPFKTITFGFDILEKNTGISLSGLMQLAGESGKNEAVKSYIISAGYNF